MKEQSHPHLQASVRGYDIDWGRSRRRLQALSDSAALLESFDESRRQGRLTTPLARHLYNEALVLRDVFVLSSDIGG